MSGDDPWGSQKNDVVCEVFYLKGYVNYFEDVELTFARGPAARLCH